MAAAADPRPKPSSGPPPHLSPWSPPPRERPVPSLSAASGGAARDRRRPSSTSHRRGGGGAAVQEGAYEGRLEDLRAKLMGHLRDAAERLRLAPPAPKPRSPEREPPAATPPPPPQQDAAAATAAARPWNLRDRKRRPSARGAAAVAAPPSATSPWVSAAEKEARVALSAEEVEEDIYALTGARPRRRPRKRPRVVQRQLDSLFPGRWLTEITADAYKVADE
ncbi:hypothetical protein ACP4OV_030274 [Aristida adscensionis]